MRGRSREKNVDEVNRSTLGLALFAKSVTRILCADGGSDIILLPKDLLDELMKRGPVLNASTFNTTHHADTDLQSTTMNLKTWFMSCATEK